MKIKHLLALASLLIGVGSLQAQTNLLAGWDGGTNTNSPSEFGWTSSANRTLQKRNNGGGIRMMTTYSGYKLEDGTAYTYAENSDPSSVIFWVRYNTAGESFTYTFQGLEAGHIYKFSGLLGWHNNSNTPTMTVEVRGTNSIAKTSKTISAKQTLYAADMGFTVPADETATDFQLIFTCNQTGDCMEAISALSLVEDFDAYLPTLQGKLDEANAMKEAKMDATVAANLTTAINDGQGVIDGSDHTLATINAVLIPLAAAIDEANASIEGYARLKSVMDNAIGDFAAVTADYEAGSVSDIDDAIAAVRAATKAEAMKTQGTEASPADWTKVIANPGFEEYETLVRDTKGGQQNNPAGWSNSKTWSDDAWNYAVKSTDNATEGSSSFKVRFNWAADTYTLSQTVTALPRGKYKMTVDVKNYNANGSKCNAQLSINDFETESTTVTDATTLEKVFTLSEEGKIDISLTATYILGNGSCEGILYWDNVTLTHYGEEAIEAAELAEAKGQLEAKLTAANGALATAVNSGDAAFQIPASAVAALQTAIATAQSIYDESTDKAAVTAATAPLEEATSTYLATEINAPADGQLFNIILTATEEGWEQDNKAMTYLAGARTGQGGYNIQYEAETNPNLAQAFTFTKVSGNNYKLSQIDADGNVRYMTTGTPYGGNDNQVRTSTNADDAMLVTVIPTALEGVWNLLNVAANQYIGSQDAGVYTVDRNKNFKIVETTKPSITINTADAGWGTVILPFSVTPLPKGVKAYTCEAVDGATLSLDEVTALEANKPYIIEGAWNETLTGDAQGTALTYTVGLLTGTYARTYAPSGSYILQNNDSKVGFYLCGEDNMYVVGKNRCYLTVPNGTGVKAFFFGEQEDAINNIRHNVESINNIYDLTGRQVNKATKGIYIVNGKKVLIK